MNYLNRSIAKIITLLSFILFFTLLGYGQGNSQNNPGNSNGVWQANGQDITWTTRDVGINTSNPNFELDLIGSQHTSGLLLVDSNARIKGTALIGQSILIDGQNDRITTNSGHLSFGNDTLTTGGHAGIGISNPQKRFEVGGDARIHNDLFVDGKITTNGL